jgi:putative acetyltransferase
VTDLPLVTDLDPSDLDGVRDLLQEYAASLPMPLDFQGFDREFAELPGAYAPPRGALLIARAPDGIVGCVALRPLDGSICEMKRLYVRPTQRGSGLGRQLVQAIVARGRELGYERMRLDTGPWMTAAHALYTEAGFVEIPQYTVNPVPGARFLELEL